MKYDSSRDADVVLPSAAEVRGKVVELNETPVNRRRQLRVDSSADRRCESGIGEAARADVCAAEQDMCERRNASWPGNLRSKQECVERGTGAARRAVMAVEVR